MTRTLPLAAWAVLCMTILLVGPIVHADDVEKAFREAKKEAKGHTRAKDGKGNWHGKQKTIEVLALDNEARSAEVLVNWGIKSLKFSRKDLERGLAEAKEDFEKTEKVLLRKYEKMPPGGKGAGEDKKFWEEKRDAVDVATVYIEAEQKVVEGIGKALARMTSDEAVLWMAQKGLGKLQKEAGSDLMQMGAVRAILTSGIAEARGAALRAAGPKGLPRIQSEVFQHLGEHKPPEGFRLLLKGLTYEHPTARRQAIWALRSYDRLESVKPMIDAFSKADGMVAQELEDALHYFTGNSFEADGSVWKRWWADAGEEWLAKAESKRHAPVKTKHTTTGTSFYDIPTPSLRIVFVLDRSGSMEKPAGEKTQKVKPRGPVTGGETKPSQHGRVGGSTKMEVAKNQLARSIKNLPGAVHFNVVFYGEDIQVWQDPPHLIPATPANKDAAIKWFMAIEAKGATPLFKALMTALEYAIPTQTPGKTGKKIVGGADTIYLLTDGSPTEDGELLSKEVRYDRYQKFLASNRIARCTVHTIGVGPKHAKPLLKRIAKESGGEYRAVGVD